jgi:peptide/nickel transport system permease protein
VRGLSGTRWFNVGHADGGIGGWIRWISLPSLAVSVGLVGVYGLYLRSAMLISLRQPYADTARAKGISEARLLVRHALRNSSIPFVSVLSLDLASVVGWTLAIDYVFGMRGLAEYFFNALNVQADPNTMTAVLVVVAAIVAICTLVGDLAVGLLDPRIRAES